MARDGNENMPLREIETVERDSFDGSFGSGSGRVSRLQLAGTSKFSFG